MKYAFLLLLAAIAAQADPVVSEIEWEPACDGATIELVSDHGQMMSVRAMAVHSAVTTEWTIHYLDGRPVTAEFRESERGRVTEGENAGDYTGVNRLKRLQTFKWQGEGFMVEDKALRESLEGILVKVQAARDKEAKPRSSD
ncbi:hypothetical protein [Luteolibacter soli]|uniref:Uncharacterized protein n=1 Tax=Luteolibacter soli TaxID=3135280 RepID=A0ABU9ASP4_9BACT